MFRVGQTMELIVLVVNPGTDVRRAASALAAQDTCIEEDALMLHGLHRTVHSTVKKVQTTEHKTHLCFLSLSSKPSSA